MWVPGYHGFSDKGSEVTPTRFHDLCSFLQSEAPKGPGRLLTSHSPGPWYLHTCTPIITQYPTQPSPQISGNVQGTPVWQRKLCSHPFPYSFCAPRKPLCLPSWPMKIISHYFHRKSSGVDETRPLTPVGRRPKNMMNRHRFGGLTGMSGTQHGTLDKTGLRSSLRFQGSHRSCRPHFHVCTLQV